MKDGIAFVRMCRDLRGVAAGPNSIEEFYTVIVGGHTFGRYATYADAAREYNKLEAA